eukprot:9075722-Ditylum_brightwellii.AAC.1
MRGKKYFANVSNIVQHNQLCEQASQPVRNNTMTEDTKQQELEKIDDIITIAMLELGCKIPLPHKS